MTSRIHLVARIMDWATCLALALLIPVVVIGFWSVSVATLPFSLPLGYEPGMSRLRLGLLPHLPVVFALAWTLLQMHRLFAGFRAGEILTQNGAILIRRIGMGLLAVAVLRILATPLQSLIITLPAPPGLRSLVISLHGADVGFFLAAGLMAVIGWAMEDAARAAEENRSFV